MRSRSLVLGLVVGGFLWGADLWAEPSAAPSVAVETSPPGKLHLASDLLRHKGKAHALRREVELRVGEGATIKPSFTSSLPVGERGVKVPVQTVEVDNGRVDAFLPGNKEARGVLLQGPDKVLSIATKGHMVMNVSDEEIVIAAVSGDVLVGQDSKFKPLAEGTARRISRKTKVSVDVALPTKPSLSSMVGLSVVLTGSVKVPLSTTSKFAIRVTVVDEQGTLVTEEQTVQPGAPIVVEIPRAGIYFAVARNVGEGGVVGPLSEPVKIQVLGLAPGQRPPDAGVFLLNDGERVWLSGTEGLEVRYGNSPTFVPATASIGLSQERETQVEFCNPDEPRQNAILHLAPRFKRKEIELGPSEARWPGNPVKMRLGFWDGAGNLARPGKDMQVHVTVNSAKVDVSWRRTEAGLVADLERQKGAGPWVVRVDVQDKKGRTIARDLLEVAAH